MLTFYICKDIVITLSLQNNYNPMTAANILNLYEPITLDEMSGIRLMNRTDTKFVTTTSKLYKLLEMAAQAYRVQEIDGRRMASYYTMYFDTESHAMYLAHHNGRKNRQKLRIRSYVDSGLNFLEVKTKNNHGRTKKKRVEMENFDPRSPRYDISFADQTEVSPDYGVFLNHYLRYRPETLVEHLENRFDRITLVNKKKTERLTIDTNLRFHNVLTGKKMSMDGLAIIELKRDGLAESPILEMLRQLRIQPMGFSKYCMGTALTNDSMKRNRFKPRLMMIERMRRLETTEQP